MKLLTIASLILLTGSVSNALPFQVPCPEGTKADFQHTGCYPLSDFLKGKVSDKPVQRAPTTINKSNLKKIQPGKGAGNYREQQADGTWTNM